MNETEAWQVFASTGKIQDYLKYITFKSTITQKAADEQIREYENIHNGTYHQTTEYR